MKLSASYGVADLIRDTFKRGKYQDLQARPFGDPLGGLGGLTLPKFMSADVSGAVDMEKVKPGPNTSYWIAMIEGVVRMLFPTPLPGSRPELAKTPVRSLRQPWSLRFWGRCS